MSQKFTQGIKFLAQRGLNLYAVFDCAVLPDDIAEMLQSQDIPLAEYSRLVLLGHGGKQLWRSMAEIGWRTDDPVDHHSLTATETFIADYLDGPAALMLYPTGYLIPLQRLGQLAGWSHPSPLGLGISAEFGVWFAYRSAFLTTADLPLTEVEPTTSPCDTCRDKPCITTCPAKAVRGINQFDIPACTGFRVVEDSVCADRCLARMACPVAPEHRYSIEQIQYHYGRSLETIRLYQTNG